MEGTKAGQTKQEEFLVERQKRIRKEDSRLRRSKNQRKVATLDYIRRGRQKDGIEILPDIIDLAPLLLENGAVNLEAPDFDSEQCRKSIIEEYAKFEKDLTEEDEVVRKSLENYGVKPKENGSIFLDREWCAKIAESFQVYDRTKDKKNPQSDEDFEMAKRKKLEAKLGTILEGDISAFIEGYKLINIPFPERDFSSPIKKFLFEHRPLQGFQRSPKLSEYVGPKIEKPPRFIDQEPKADLALVARDAVPNFKGGVILDGNFGFDENRNPLRPKDKLIIDHHDKFNTEARDTATTMTFAFLEDPKQLALLDDPQYQDENGVVKITTNNIDSDSILSTWVLYNRQYLLELKKKEPKRYSSLKNILCKVTEAGDFLLGSRVMEYGATARDYEYIIRNYLDACREQIKDGRRVHLTKKLGELENQQMGIKTQLEEVEQLIKKRSEDADVSEKVREIENAKKGLNRTGAPLEKGTQGNELRRLNQELRDLLGELSERKKTLGAELQILEKEIAVARKNMEKAQTQPITQSENTLLLSHMHDSVLDIIKNPFKYQKFMQQGRETENAVIQQMDSAYREGNIDITQDVMDSDILLVRPLKSATLPENESHDGEYFYYRGREDFNRELIVKFEGKFFMMAINTQNMKGLQKYNFDDLIDIFRTKEAEAVKGLIEAKQSEIESLAGSNNDKRIAELRRELETLKADGIRNDKGQIWRSRTQMIFAFKSYIPENEIMKEIYVWKEAQSRPERLKNLNRQTAELFPGKKLGSLREQVGKSFSVPQFGQHHNEGIFMDTHLQLMFQGMQEIELGNFPEDIPESIRQILQRTIAGNQDSLRKYIFLHDIAKTETLRVTYTEGKTEELTLDQWLAMIPSDARENPVLLQNFMKEKGIQNISYYHKDTEPKTHGEEGKKYLEQFGSELDVPPHLLTAISLHEISYQFTKINVDTYNKFFSDLSPNEVAWVITASYLDTVASKGPNGKPMLENFKMMANSVHNGQILKQVEGTLAERREELDPKKVARVIQNLKKTEEVFPEGFSETIPRLIDECVWDKYDRNKLSSVLDALIMAGNITADQKDELLDAIGEDGLLDETLVKKMRSHLGSANTIVNEALKSSRV